MSMIAGTNRERRMAITTSMSSPTLSITLRKPAVVNVEMSRVVALAV
jgi:hypothetical protein